MVTGIIIAIVAVAAALFFFKDKIGAFAASSIAAPIEQFGKSAAETFLDPIKKAGEAAGRDEAERLRQEQIDRAERDIEKAALDQGFSSIEEFNRATDSGSIVIGGSRTIVDFGLIGNVIPTDPSPEFIKANPDLFASKGTKRFGGQTGGGGFFL